MNENNKTKALKENKKFYFFSFFLILIKILFAIVLDIYKHVHIYIYIYICCYDQSILLKSLITLYYRDTHLISFFYHRSPSVKKKIKEEQIVTNEAILIFYFSRKL